MQVKDLKQFEKMQTIAELQNLSGLPETYLYNTIDCDEISDKEVLKWAKIYNSAIEKLLKAIICSIISKIREQNIQIRNEKNYHHLSEQSDLLCNNLYGTIEKSIDEISNRVKDVPTKTKDFYSKEYARKRRTKHISRS